MLEQIGPDIWVMDGPHVLAAAGFHYPTRMTIIRLENGDMIVISPIAFSIETLNAVLALGPVMHLVAPNALHHLALGDWMATCQNAKTYAAPRLQTKRRDLSFTCQLGDVSPRTREIDTVLMAPHLIRTRWFSFITPVAQRCSLILSNSCRVARTAAFGG